MGGGGWSWVEVGVEFSNTHLIKQRNYFANRKAYRTSLFIEN